VKYFTKYKVGDIVKIKRNAIIVGRDEHGDLVRILRYKNALVRDEIFYETENLKNPQSTCGYYQSEIELITPSEPVTVTVSVTTKQTISYNEDEPIPFI